MERFFKHTHTFFTHPFQSHVSRKRADVPLTRSCHGKGLLSPTYRETIFRYTFLFENFAVKSEKSATRNELFKARVIGRGIWREV